MIGTCAQCLSGSLCVRHRPGGSEFWEELPDHTRTTICAKCTYRCRTNLCSAPGWTKTRDFVTGDMTPALDNCRARNQRGECRCFKPKQLLRRMWNALLDQVLNPKKGPTPRCGRRPDRGKSQTREQIAAALVRDIRYTDTKKHEYGFIQMDVGACLNE